jgi:uncharacterized membrane protein
MASVCVWCVVAAADMMCVLHGLVSQVQSGGGPGSMWGMICGLLQQP